jgi:hypothetical protein
MPTIKSTWLLDALREDGPAPLEVSTRRDNGHGDLQTIRRTICHQATDGGAVADSICQRRSVLAS